jgi:hypothetical protein
MFLVQKTSNCSICKLFFICLQSCQHTLLSLQLELRGELDVESDEKTSLSLCALNWHTLVLDLLARLGADLFVNGNGHLATIKSPEGARDALKSLLQGNLLSQDQVVT